MKFEEKKEIIKVLRTKGKIVAIKTDTVYGIVCNANDEAACEKIFELKRREIKKPLSIFVKNIEEVKKYIDKDQLTDKVVNLMKKYWPGALTIILRKKDRLFSHLSFNLDTIGIRIPNDEELLSILEEIDFPLAQTSCNISGEPEYDSIELIKQKFGKDIDLIVDGGKILKSNPSTVIKVIDDKIEVIRQGAVFLDEWY